MSFVYCLFIDGAHLLMQPFDCCFVVSPHREARYPGLLTCAMIMNKHKRGRLR